MAIINSLGSTVLRTVYFSQCGEPWYPCVLFPVFTCGNAHALYPVLRTISRLRLPGARNHLNVHAAGGSNARCEGVCHQFALRCFWPLPLGLSGGSLHCPAVRSIVRWFAPLSGGSPHEIHGPRKYRSASRRYDTIRFLKENILCKSSCHFQGGRQWMLGGVLPVRL